MKKHLLVLLVFLLPTAGPVPAGAAVTWDMDPEETADTPSAGDPRDATPAAAGPLLLEARLPQALAEMQAQGFASDLPVSVVARQIVPSELSISVDPGSKGRKTSWKGGKPWRESLEDAIRPLGLEARLVAGTVTISPATRAPGASGRPIELRKGASQTSSTNPANAISPNAISTEPGSLTPLAPGQNGGPAVVPAPADGSQVISAAAIPVTPMQLWNVEPRSTLRSLLEEWAAKAGWSIAWQSDYDFRIEAKASFAGSFQEASSQLIRSFGSSTPRIKATFWAGNKVVVIEMASDSVAP